MLYSQVITVFLNFLLKFLLIFLFKAFLSEVPVKISRQLFRLTKWAKASSSCLSSSLCPVLVPHLCFVLVPWIGCLMSQLSLLRVVLIINHKRHQDCQYIYTRAEYTKIKRNKALAGKQGCSFPLFYFKKLLIVMSFTLIFFNSSNSRWRLFIVCPIVGGTFNLLVSAIQIWRWHLRLKWLVAVSAHKQNNSSWTSKLQISKSDNSSALFT